MPSHAAFAGLAGLAAMSYYRRVPGAPRERAPRRALGTRDGDNANHSAKVEYVSLAAPPRCPSKACSFAAMDKCRRARCLACGSGRGPVLFADLYVDGVGVTVGLGIGKVAFAHGRNFSFGGLVHKAPLQNELGPARRHPGVGPPGHLWGDRDGPSGRREGPERDSRG